VSEFPDNRKLFGRFPGLARLSCCYEQHVDEEEWNVIDRAKRSYALDSKAQSRTAENRNV
jgi:hypothetical protein